MSKPTDKIPRFPATEDSPVLRERFAELQQRYDMLLARQRSYHRFLEMNTNGVWRCSAKAPISVQWPEEKQAHAILALGRVEECNQTLARQHGYDRGDDLIGRRLADLLGGAPEEKLERMLAFIRGNYSLSRYETRLVRPDGSAIWIQQDILGTIEDGLWVGAWGVQRDVTAEKKTMLDLKESGERVWLRAERMAGEISRHKQYAESILHSVAEGVFTVDTENHILSWNPGAQAITGYLAEEAIGQDSSMVLAITTPTGIPLANSADHPIARACSTRKSVPPLDLVLKTKDGRDTAIALSAAPLLDERGIPAGAVGVIRDASRERQLIESIQHANRAKSQFLANMSHEIRTPINAILGFAQLILENGAVRGQDQQRLQTIARSGEHLLSLLNETLEMSKLDAGRTVPHTSTVDLRDLLSDLVAIFKLRTEAKGLKFRVELGPDLPYVVTTDGNKVRQVFSNLLGNAIKFTERGGVTWIVDGRRGEAGERWLVSEVRDTGPGIPESERERIFAPFEQGMHKAPSSGGVGLGLAISRGFARLLGGDIIVTSEIGRGSCFSVEMRVEEGVLPAESWPMEPTRGTFREEQTRRSVNPLSVAKLDPRSLPPRLAADLREATIKGDYELMIAVIEAMGGYDPSIGDSLRGLAERFDYKRILEYLAEEGTP